MSVQSVKYNTSKKAAQQRPNNEEAVPGLPWRLALSPPRNFGDQAASPASPPAPLPSHPLWPPWSISSGPHRLGEISSKRAGTPRVCGRHKVWPWEPTLVSFRVVTMNRESFQHMWPPPRHCATCDAAPVGGPAVTSAAWRWWWCSRDATGASTLVRYSVVVPPCVPARPGEYSCRSITMVYYE